MVRIITGGGDVLIVFVVWVLVLVYFNVFLWLLINFCSRIAGLGMANVC